jgi:hypothetical protein
MENLIHFDLILFSYSAAAEEDLVYFALLADVEPVDLKMKYMKKVLKNKDTKLDPTWIHYT